MEMKLTEEFLAPYKEKQPNFGFNGLGYIVYKRTYARRVEGEDRTEEWWETVRRCVEGAQEIGADYTQEEMERLYDYVFNLKGNFAGRMLWQLGTPTVKKYGGASLLNCFGENTKILTKDLGWMPISALRNTVQTILTKQGKWVDAPIRHFGKQKLTKVEIYDKYNPKTKKIIEATPDHDWLVIKKDGTIKTKTKNLKKGDKLPITVPRVVTKYLSPQGIQHGLTFGDGFINTTGAVCDLIDQTIVDCEKYFQENKSYDLSTETYKRKQIVGLPKYYKDLPSTNESIHYLLGFLAGWIAADGNVHKTHGTIRLFNKNKETIDRVKDYASICGFRTSEPRLDRQFSPFDGSEKHMWSISFCLEDNPHKLIIREDHKKYLKPEKKESHKYAIINRIIEGDGEEHDVYCATVPDTHEFVIDSHIRTGNCWYTSMREYEDFCFIFDNLMLGGGVGFSVRREDIHELPRINRNVVIKHEKTNDADFIVPDSREGWVELLRKVLDVYFNGGKSFTYSTILIRGAGEPIKGFGGTASGPKILIDGITLITELLDKRGGKKLRSTDVLDIVNILGSIVVAGNVRRSAEIAIGDHDDIAYVKAKRWDLGNIPDYRGMSNNSIDIREFDEDVLPQIWAGYKGNGEPYGFVNMPLSRKYGRLKDGVMVKSDLYPTTLDNCEGFNPCAEITLADGEACNLCELYLNNLESKEEAIDLAKLLYKTQKCIWDLPFAWDKTTKITQKNRRIGLGVTGVCQSLDKLDWLDEVYLELRKFDKEWSEHKGIPRSIKLTTVKPSGTLSLLAGSTPGVHGEHAPYYIRRIRISSNDPLVKILKDAGFNMEYALSFEGKEKYSQLVVDFPCKGDENAIMKPDMAAIKQLELVKKLQTEWSDNAVSVTVTYKPEELEEIQQWLKDNYKNSVKSVSFLLYNDHGFAQAPYEDISEEQYNKMVEKLDLDFYKKITTNEVIEGLECEGGACPIR